MPRPAASLLLPLAAGFQKAAPVRASFPKPERKNLMSKKIQIICTSPGMRRNGIAHPATAFYDKGHWTEEQIAAFRADPNFTVREADENENTQTADDFEARVKAEVDARVQAKTDELAKSFDQAVSDAVAERMDAAGKALNAEQEKVKALEAKVTGLEKAAEKQTAKK